MPPRDPELVDQLRDYARRLDDAVAPVRFHDAPLVEVVPVTRVARRRAVLVTTAAAAAAIALVVGVVAVVAGRSTAPLTRSTTSVTHRRLPRALEWQPGPSQVASDTEFAVYADGAALPKSFRAITDDHDVVLAYGSRCNAARAVTRTTRSTRTVITLTLDAGKATTGCTASTGTVLIPRGALPDDQVDFVLDAPSISVPIAVTLDLTVPKQFAETVRAVPPRAAAACTITVPRRGETPGQVVASLPVPLARVSLGGRPAASLIGADAGVLPEAVTIAPGTALGDGDATVIAPRALAAADPLVGAEPGTRITITGTANGCRQTWTVVRVGSTRTEFPPVSAELVVASDDSYEGRRVEAVLTATMSGVPVQPPGIPCVIPRAPNDAFHLAGDTTLALPDGRTFHVATGDLEHPPPHDVVFDADSATPGEIDNPGGGTVLDVPANLDDVRTGSVVTLTNTAGAIPGTAPCVQHWVVTGTTYPGLQPDLRLFPSTPEGAVPRVVYAVPQ